MSIPKQFNEKVIELFTTRWKKGSADTPYNAKNEFKPVGVYADMCWAWHEAGILLNHIRQANRYHVMSYIEMRGDVETCYPVYLSEAEIESLTRNVCPLSVQDRLLKLQANITAKTDEDGRVPVEANIDTQDLYPMSAKGLAKMAKE